MLATPIVHDPFMFALGPLKLTGFGLAMMAAFGIAHMVAQSVLRQRGDDDEIMNDVTFAALVGTIVGGKLYFAINETVAGRPFVSALFSRAGFVYWGGFLGSVLLAWLVIRWRRQSFLRIADGAAVGIAAGYRPHRMLGGRRRLRPPVERSARRVVPARDAAIDRRQHERRVPREPAGVAVTGHRR